MPFPHVPWACSSGTVARQEGPLGSLDPTMAPALDGGPDSVFLLGPLPLCHGPGYTDPIGGGPYQPDWRSTW